MAAKSTLTNMVLVLTGVCLVCAALLGGAYVITKDPIAQADKDKTVKALSEVLPEFDTISEEPLQAGDCNYYVAEKDGAVVGYAIESKTGGFGGELVVMVGIDAKTGHIYNTAPLKHNETPGLGAKCDDATGKFRKQWQDLDPSAHAFEVKKDIDAITASTITSKAYTKAVTQALAAYAVISSEEPTVISSEEPTVISSEAEGEVEKSMEGQSHE